MWLDTVSSHAKEQDWGGLFPIYNTLLPSLRVTGCHCSLRHSDASLALRPIPYKTRTSLQDKQKICAGVPPYNLFRGTFLYQLSESKANVQLTYGTHTHFEHFTQVTDLYGLNPIIVASVT